MRSWCSTHRSPVLDAVTFGVALLLCALEATLLSVGRAFRLGLAA
jgi:hypothetical protein